MELPTVRGLYLCEQVIIEEKARNASLINIFTKRIWHSGHHQHPIVMFTVLCGIRGTISMTILVTELATGEEVFKQVRPFTLLDPIFDHRMLYRFTELTFPNPGVFEFSILVEGEPIAYTRLTVLEEFGP